MQPSSLLPSGFPFECFYINESVSQRQIPDVGKRA